MRVADHVAGFDMHMLVARSACIYPHLYKYTMKLYDHDTIKYSRLILENLIMHQQR